MVSKHDIVHGLIGVAGFTTAVELIITFSYIPFTRGLMFGALSGLLTIAIFYICKEALRHDR